MGHAFFLVRVADEVGGGVEKGEGVVVVGDEGECACGLHGEMRRRRWESKWKCILPYSYSEGNTNVQTLKHNN